MNDQENKNYENNTYTIEAKKKALTNLENFVREDDSAKYFIDPKNVVCRKNDNADKVSCLKLNELDKKEIFSQMQKLGFYCALAQDPNNIGLECNKDFPSLIYRDNKVQKMYFEEKTIIDTTFHQIITTEHKRILCDALLKQCDKILKEIPPNNNYQYWDVYTGTAGLSLLFLKLHERDPGLMFGAKSALTIADEYIDRALTTYMGQYKLTFDGLPNAIEHECSFLCTVVGLYAVAAQVKHHTGDQESSKRYLDLIQSRYLKAALSPKTPNELFYGRAGYLYSLRYISGLIDLMEEDKENPVSQISQIISSVIECIIEDGKRTAVNHQATSYIPLLWIWLDYPYVGASHGFAGILTMLLQFPKKCQEYMSLIKNTTDYILFKCRQVNGNWPSILSETSNDFIQFCHGAPGICFLACKAYEVFKDEEYLNLAKEIADYTYLHGRTRKGAGLCHGISGNAYPFLSVYQLTKDQKYLQYAFEYAEICINWETKTNREEFVVPDRPWSIFEGLGGSAWLIADLLYWDREVFKGFPGLTDV